MTERISDYGPRIKIEDSETKAIAQHVLDTMKLSVLKGVAHTDNPQEYPLEDKNDSVEKIAVEYLQKKSQERQNEARTNARQMIGDSASFVDRSYASFVGVDFRSSLPIMEQTESLNLSSTVKFNLTHFNQLELSENTIRLRQDVSSVTNLTDRVIERRAGDFLRQDMSVLTGSTDRIIAPNLEDQQPQDVFTATDLTGRDVTSELKDQLRQDVSTVVGTVPDDTAEALQFALQFALRAQEDITQKYSQLGGKTGFLGKAVGNIKVCPDGRGRYQHYENGGSIYWSPETGAHEVHGAIRIKWSQLHWAKGYLGYPTTDELPIGDTVGRFSDFQGGTVYWTPDTGARVVHKKLRQAFAKHGGVLGALGYPLGDSSTINHDWHGRFQGGKLIAKKNGETRLIVPKKNLQLRIHRVKCIDETNPEWWGSDEIDMGGVATSLNNSSTAKIAPFRVSKSFDDGEEFIYNPPRVFCNFDLQKISGWPKNFLVTMALTEVDSGGFNSFLDKLVQMVRDKVVKMVVEKVAALTGAAIGSVIGALGGPIGALIGALVGWVIGELFDFIIGLFKDDPFPVWTVNLGLPSIWYRWSGKSDSPEYSFWTEDHGGKYQVWFDWALT
ncbi:MAG: hypothetical protein ACFBSF_17825 [Leptolyngbyaceae cyanobacterium]